MQDTYSSFVSVTTPLLHFRPENILVLCVVLIVSEELLLLVNKLIVFEWADLSVTYGSHVESLSVCLKVLSQQPKRPRQNYKMK